MTDRDHPTPIAPAEVRPAVARLLVAGALLAVTVVPAVQHLLPPGAGPFGDFFQGGFQAWRGLAAGHLLEPRAWLDFDHALLAHIDTLENELEDQSAVLETFLPTVQWALARFGGVGNETTYLGRDGWLLLRPGFDYLVGPPFLDPAVIERRRTGAPSWRPPPHADPRPALADFHRQLEERGITLLVLMVPTKPMVHPEALAAELAETETALDNPSADQLRRWLEARGIAVVDAAPILRAHRQATGEDAFLRTDSHWSPGAVGAVADALAEQIPRVVELEGRLVFYRRRQQPHRGTGDLTRALELPKGQRLFPPEDVTLTQILEPGGRYWQEDASAEILLLGDSFSNVYSEERLGWGRYAGLAEQLSERLRRPLGRIAVNDGSATAVRERLALAAVSGRDRLEGKKLVIYQVAVRELTVGDWRPVDLGAGVR